MNRIKKLSVSVLIFIFAAGAANAQKSYDLKKFPQGKTPEEIGNRVLEKFIATPHSMWGNPNIVDRTPTKIHYADVCVWLGELWFAKETANKEQLASLEERFLPFFDEEKSMMPEFNHVDFNVFGTVPLEIYMMNKDKRFLNLGLKYADTQWNLPGNAKPEEKQWADKGYSWQTRIWIDDMFMITAIQAQAYRVTGDVKYINRAAREMVFYLDTIQLDNGLFYHAPEAHFNWARGNGWMAVGMAEILRALPKDNPDRPRIMEGYKKMMAALHKYQDEEGMWHQLINEKESYKETSGTAMFTYAMITGVKNGWLDKKVYGESARKGWLALTDFFNENDQLTDICVGTNIKNDINHYLNRPTATGDHHGQAPLLWCALALIR